MVGFPGSEILISKALDTFSEATPKIFIENIEANLVQIEKKKRYTDYYICFALNVYNHGVFSALFDITPEIEIFVNGEWNSCSLMYPGESSYGVPNKDDKAYLLSYGDYRVFEVLAKNGKKCEGGFCYRSVAGDIDKINIADNDLQGKITLKHSLGKDYSKYFTINTKGYQNLFEWAKKIPEHIKMIEETYGKGITLNDYNALIKKEKVIQRYLKRQGIA